MLLELVLPALLTLQYAIVIGFTATDNNPAIVLTILAFLFGLPVGTAWLQQRCAPRARWWDAWIVVAAGYLVFDVALWFFGIPLYAIYFVGFLLIRKRERYGRAYIALLVFCTGTLLLSGGGLDEPPLAFGLPLVLALGSFVPYFRVLDRERWLARPTIPLALGMMYLTPACLLTHFGGASTPWLANTVLRQPGAELLRPASQDLVGPRSLVPVEEGLFVYTNDDSLFLVRDGEHGGELVKHPAEVFIGRIDAPLCDPEDRAICYVPNVDSGLSVVDTGTGDVRTDPVPPGHYDLINVDPEGAHWALISDSGRVVTFLERAAPGELVVMSSLDMKEENPDWVWSRAVDIEDGVARILLRTTEGRLQVLSYDLDTGERWPLFATVEDGYGRSWHAVTVQDERVIYTTLSGKILIFDWQGHLIWKKQLVPILRQVLYDRQRGLAYAVDDFGFISIVDPFEPELLAFFWAGPKAKNLHLEDGFLYVGSAAGLFRFDIDTAVGTRRRAEASG